MYLFKHLLLIIDLLKGKGHKYIKRVPVGVDKKLEYGIDILKVAKKESIKDAILNERNFNLDNFKSRTNRNIPHLQRELAKQNEAKRKATEKNSKI